MKYIVNNIPWFDTLSVKEEYFIFASEIVKDETVGVDLIGWMCKLELVLNVQDDCSLMMDKGDDLIGMLRNVEIVSNFMWEITDPAEVSKKSIIL